MKWNEMWKICFLSKWAKQDKTTTRGTHEADYGLSVPDERIQSYVEPHNHPHIEILQFPLKSSKPNSSE